MNKAINKYKLKRSLISFVYPNRCPFCNATIDSDKYYDKECLTTLDEYTETSINTAYCRYNEKSIPFIFKAKENGNGYAISAAAYLLANKLSSSNFIEGLNLVIPIPAKKSSIQKRGYSFPHILAKEIAELLNIDFSAKCLLSSRNTLPQKGLSGIERIINVKNAFKMGKMSVKGLNVLIVDDIFTTGSTLAEAKKVLLENGASSVNCAAFAAAGDADIDY